MFLAELGIEEKEAFLELAALVARVDGNLSVFEVSVLKKYRKEMGLEGYKIKNLTLEEILAIFKSERTQNIILTELFQLIYADGVYHDNERESVRLIKKHFGFDQSVFESYKDWIDKIKELSILKAEPR